MATAIADGVASVPAGERDPSLAGGHAGLALLYAWLAAALGRPEDAARTDHHLSQAVGALATEPMDASLWGGFPGVAWAVELVDARRGRAGADRNGAVDDALARMLDRAELWPVPHDLVTGVTGAGVYALERHGCARGHGVVARVVERLVTSARHDADGAFWWTEPEAIDDPEVVADHPLGLANLGVAHGVPGAVALLGLTAGAGVAPSGGRALLDDAVRWLWAQAIPGPEGPTFPLWSSARPAAGPARSAWCYGDPGVAAALLVAARAVGEPAWEREATALAVRAARRPPEACGVVDAAFCHGTAGLAHVFNRLYQATGEPELGAAARRWLDETLAWCDQASSGDPDWVAKADAWDGVDIVDGAAGVALVLLAAATAVEPAWDRMFLLS